MITREIPRKEWVGFFNDFSKKHSGWVATIEEVGSDIGDQEEAIRLPLVGISADLKSGQNRIEITVGGQPESDVDRIVDSPTRVWFRHSEEEQYDALDIESEGPHKTIVQFQFVPVNQTDRQLPQDT